MAQKNLTQRGVFTHYWDNDGLPIETAKCPFCEEVNGAYWSDIHGAWQPIMFKQCSHFQGLISAGGNKTAMNFEGYMKPFWA